MKAKPVVPRELARRDVDEAIDHYANEGSEEVALRFVDSLRRAYEHIGRHPSSGSPRWAEELSIPGLRCWQVGRFPYLVFYVERRDRVDVWRVLDGRRDIPAWMQEPPAPPDDDSRSPSPARPEIRTLPRVVRS